MSALLVEELPDDDFDVRDPTPVVEVPEDVAEVEDPDDLTEEDERFFEKLIAGIMIFIREFGGDPLYTYQDEMIEDLVTALVMDDSNTKTVIAARQSGKSHGIAVMLAALMVLLPKLALVFPNRLGKFRSGLFVGVFGPIEDQGATIWGRVVSMLTSDRATEMMLDPDLDDRPRKGGKGEKSPTLYLRNSGSLVRLQSANPRSKIESKSYHIVVIDEAQEADEFTIGKSISPMLAHYNGLMVLTGTASRQKGFFYKQIQRNKRRHANSRVRRRCRDHIEWDYRRPAKENPSYAKYIAKEKATLGEDSDEFKLAYLNQWMLERGMFITENALDEMLDPSMEIIRSWWDTPVVVGIDPARTKDSTVVTVCYVDWLHPDPFGFMPMAILNWLELNNSEWEAQYGSIMNFLRHYNVGRVAVDSQGMGGPVAERLQVLMPRIDVVPVPSDPVNQNKRWTHLTEILERRLLLIPGHSRAKRLKTHRRFYQQMVDAEKIYRGQSMLVQAPDEEGAFDDYVDSLALAAWCTEVEEMSIVQQEESPFVRR